MFLPHEKFRKLKHHCVDPKFSHRGDDIFFVVQYFFIVATYYAAIILLPAGTSIVLPEGYIIIIWANLQVFFIYTSGGGYVAGQLRGDRTEPPGHVPPPPRHLPQGHIPPGHLPPGHLPPRTHATRSLTPWTHTPWIHPLRTYTPQTLKCPIWFMHHVLITYCTLDSIYFTRMCR